MSNAGLRIHNQDGILQIDQNYRNLFLANKRVYARIFKGGYGSVMYYSPLYEDSLIACDLSPKSNDIAESAFIEWNGRTGIYPVAEVRKYGDILVSVTKMDPNWCIKNGYPACTYQLGILNDNVELTPTEGYTITVYEFNFALEDSSTSGLIVRDQDGNIVFDANKKPLRVVSFLEREVPIAILDNAGGGNSYIAHTKYNLPYPNLSSDKKYAICFLEHSVQFGNEIRNDMDDIVNSSGWFFLDYISFQQSMARVYRQCLDQNYMNSSYTLFAGNRKPSCMLIDVTNY